VISGTTGWLEQYDDMVALCEAKKGAFISSSNFSLGVNLFFELNDYLAKMMAKFVSYTVEMEEIHHTEKKDAPSGTAITLAEAILAERNDINRWVNNVTQEPDELAIISSRKDPAPGTHSIRYSSSIDDIEITHTAHNRTGFANGALLAAEFTKDRSGIFNMKQVLGL
jgi:4-hydroxy-tetrahydrodipicolinate reductase